MQKSKNATIFIIALIFIYGLIGTSKLIIDINNVYLYILNPLVWISLAIFLKFSIPKVYEKKKIRNEFNSYIIIAAFSYIIFYVVSGFFVGFGKNPYSTTVYGYLINFWMTMTVLIAREYIRYKLVNNVYDNDKFLIASIIAIVYIIIDFGIYRLINSNNISTLTIIKIISQVILPSIAKNILFSYIAMYSNYMPAIIYEFVTNTYMLISPILPDSPWIINVIIEAMIPIVVFLYIRYAKLKNDFFKSRETLRSFEPRNVIPLVAMVVLATWFAIGIFPIAPVAVATGSMIPELYVGDVAIIRKCGPNDINVGDIIQYRMEGFTVVHRVIEKTQSNGEVSFITKGDNNNTQDFKKVTEDQLIGKVIAKIKYIGYPAIWLNIIQTQEEIDVTVETGK